MNRLAIKIKEARLKAKMTEKDLAKAIGQNINYIIQVESGKKIINEQVAEQILKTLGEKMENFQDVPSEPVKPKVMPATAVKKAQEPPQKAITPTGRWADALSGVVRNYDITDENGKVLGQKEHSIISKKVDQIPYDKVFFVQLTEYALNQHHIYLKDIISFVSCEAFSSNGIYYLQHNQKKMIRYVEKTSNKMAIVSTGKSENEVNVELSEVKFIGKAVKVERYL